MSERDQKKAQFEQKNKRSSIGGLVAVLLLAAVAGGGWWLLADGSGAKAIAAEGGKISIPLAAVDDGKAHFYTYRSGETDIRFFVLKSTDGVLRAALDTCDVCYREKMGYRQEGDFMVCNNCDQRFASDRINEIKGGCNPAPVNRRVEGDHLVIAESELVRGAWYFR